MSEADGKTFWLPGISASRLGLSPQPYGFRVSCSAPTQIAARIYSKRSGVFHFISSAMIQVDFNLFRKP